MLLFSTILDIRNTLTKDDFIELVIDWNQQSRDCISGIEWHGERTIEFGDNDVKLSFNEYRNQNIIAARFEKIDEDKIYWGTEIVMNFSEMRMALRLDRQYFNESLFWNYNFKSPHIIKTLAEKNLLKDDNGIPTTFLPVILGSKNLDILGPITNRRLHYKLPIVYVSKNRDNSCPLDIFFLANRLRGAAHVLVQEDVCQNRQIREICNDQNDYYGAIGVYFPNRKLWPKRFMCRPTPFCDEKKQREFLCNKIVRSVFNYVTAQNINPLYTFDGVSNALLKDRWQSRGTDLIELKKDSEEWRVFLENEYNKNYSDLLALQDKYDKLYKSSQQLQREINYHRRHRNEEKKDPILSYATEKEFFPGEFREVIVDALNGQLRCIKQGSRRYHIISDLVDNNATADRLKKTAKQLKVLLSGYKTMKPAIEQALSDLGIEIISEKNHYRLRYKGENRYMTTLPKTSSDSFRAGKNAASQMVTDFF